MIDRHYRHRPIMTDDVKTRDGKIKVRGRQPLYDLNADRLNRHIGVFAKSYLARKIAKTS